MTTSAPTSAARTVPTATIAINYEKFDDAGASLGGRHDGPGAPTRTIRSTGSSETTARVNGYVDVWSDTAGAAFYCYGSVIDNVTGDPTTILPQ